MEPVIAQSLFESIEMLKNGMTTLKERCVEGSIGLVTAMVPRLGYEACSRLAREILESGRGVCELELEQPLLYREELDELLDPENMVGPG